jgi:hypothetical protein
MVNLFVSLFALSAICCHGVHAGVPPNDQCETAYVLTSSDETTFGSTVNATQDSLNNCGENFVVSPGVWYVAQNTSGAKILSISTCGNKTNFDTAITVYSGTTCDSLLCVGGRDDDGECSSDFHQSTISWKTTPGQSYFILIHGSQAEDSGDFEMHVTVTEPLDGGTNPDKSTAMTLHLSNTVCSVLLLFVGLLLLPI